MAELGSSPYINHFIQPDTVIPDPSNPQSWNRFSYVQNNPVRYNDPTGHMRDDGATGGCNASTCDYVPPVVTQPETDGEDLDNQLDNGNDPFGIGVFTEEQLQEMGINCGENVPQVTCDIYTNGNNISRMNVSVDFVNNGIGNNVAGGICQIIQQGCIQSGIPYNGLFLYRGASNGVNWNRYIINSKTNETAVLFLANWDVTMYHGELVAKETFPLRGGDLGYATVFLKSSVVDNGIEWNSVGVSYGGKDLSVGTVVPNFINFRTEQNTFSNFFRTTGTFQLGNNTLGTVSITGYFQP